MLIISVDMSKDRLLKGECVRALSHVRLCDLWTVNLQAPLFTEFSRQGFQVQLPFSSPGTLPNPGIELTSTLTGEFFTTEATSKVSDENRQVYPELVCTAEESAATHLRLKHRAHVGVGTISGEKTGRLSSSEVVMRSWRQADRKRGVPRDCLGDRFGVTFPL